MIDSTDFSHVSVGEKYDHFTERRGPLSVKPTSVLGQ